MHLPDSSICLIPAAFIWDLGRNVGVLQVYADMLASPTCLLRLSLYICFLACSLSVHLNYSVSPVRLICEAKVCRACFLYLLCFCLCLLFHTECAQSATCCT